MQSSVTRSPLQTDTLLSCHLSQTNHNSPAAAELDLLLPKQPHRDVIASPVASVVCTTRKSILTEIEPHRSPAAAELDLLLHKQPHRDVIASPPSSPLLSPASLAIPQLSRCRANSPRPSPPPASSSARVSSLFSYRKFSIPPQNFKPGSCNSAICGSASASDKGVRGILQGQQLIQTGKSSINSEPVLCSKRIDWAWRFCFPFLRPLVI
ncbi:unnamed protein product [Linum trigynum]|uniref:Uncharacterized protein n=1 Tax=Linum trigynum TaxID=586398 RepID=A0AAV2EB70_9ROSI